MSTDLVLYVAERAASYAPSGRTVRAAQQVAIAARRDRVADMVLRHVPQREIARRENIGLGTVANDVRKIKEMWAERAADAYDDRVAREGAKLDALEAAFMGDALEGDDAAFRKVAWVMERRAKLEGLDQPARVDATVKHEHITSLDEEIERLMGELPARDADAATRG